MRNWCPKCEGRLRKIFNQEMRFTSWQCLECGEEFTAQDLANEQAEWNAAEGDR